MRVAIYGAGSLGTILGAFITKAGVEIELINRKMKAITKQYKDVYYLSVDYAFGTDWEDTIDMSHPNDLGFDRLLKSYEPKIAKILKKYGIKPNKK